MIEALLIVVTLFLMGYSLFCIVRDEVCGR